jgi:hypothetical protein
MRMRKNSVITNGAAEDSQTVCGVGCKNGLIV